ncbi:MAG: TerC family protein [Myxococcales bacterium]|nr:TerC family protein [Myxococcales bacterium]HIK84235.1 TerC family protein [Myxococcales bacterium]
MMDLLTFENFTSLGVLIFLQAVLGFDNLLYVSIESQRAPAESQAKVRRWGILIAIGLRIVLLFLIMSLLDIFEKPFFSLDWTGVIEGEFTFSTIVFLLGGGFLMYTAVREISHLLAIEHLQEEQSARPAKSTSAVIGMIVLMNLIFSFDSILSALAITKVFAVLAVAIIVSGVMMLVLADTVSAFIERNRKYEVLGLFILLIVGIVLLGEGGHEAHLAFFGHGVEPMAKSTFYFAIAVLVLVDVIQSRYQNKLTLQRAHEQRSARAPFVAS